LQELHVYSDLLATIEGVIDHLEKLFRHVICQWAVGPVDGRLHYIKKPEFVDVSVMLLPTSFMMASTAPSFMPMTA
jgi:hypothetical protein